MVNLHVVTAEASAPASDRIVGEHPRLSSTWILGWRQAGQLLIVYLCLTLVFAAVGWVAFGDQRRWWLVRVDERVADWFVDRRTSGWNTASLVGSMLSESVVKVVVTALVVLVLLRVLRRWYEATFVAVSLILEAMVFITTTVLVGRSRPAVPQLDGSPVGSSYPSGHVAAAACYGAVALVVIWHCSRRWLTVACILVATAIPLVVSAARMYRGMHFLSDVVAGLLLGVASVVITWKILSPAERSRRRSLLAEPSPSPSPI